MSENSHQYYCLVTLTQLLNYTGQAKFLLLFANIFEINWPFNFNNPVDYDIFFPFAPLTFLKLQLNSTKVALLFRQKYIIYYSQQSQIITKISCKLTFTIEVSFLHLSPQTPSRCLNLTLTVVVARGHFLRCAAPIFWLLFSSKKRGQM